jgi:OmcA/MtrC family decaheme c-type cytochrome
MVHRLHRGKNLPTLYLASSIAPAPLLPPDGPPPAALPLPFLTGRNAVAPGTKFSIWGFRTTEFLGGRVVARTENFQPPRVLAEGINFPRDLRDCDACHRDAPQRGEMVAAISRRTCQGCHPDTWFGAGPITDLVHMAHPGGPQADDTRCAGCHVAGPGLRAPIAEAHLPPLLSPNYDQPSVVVTRVEGFQASGTPTVCFQVKDRRGELDSLQSPSAGVDPDPLHPSPVPRGLARVSIVVSGPTGDYLTGNAPFSQSVALSTPRTPGLDGISQEFCHLFTTPLPATAAGTWGLGMEVRRLASVPLYDAGADLFRWPYTGESVTEYADNPVYYVDTAFGTWPGGAPAPRRNPIERNNCRSCHLEISLHGNLRHNPSYCVLCHTADATDWSRRPKGPDGNVNLATVYSDTRFGTYDGLEERSIHFKVMVHRIHTGEGQGTARIEVGAPHVLANAFFFDDVRFPNRLADCTLCHEGTTWLIEGQPADASPTIANENASITHAATASHTAAVPRWPPIAATCNSCHGTAFAYAHAAAYTEGGVEACAQCHTKGALGVPEAHGLPAPTATTGTTTSP